MPLSLKNRYDVHSADHVGRVVYFSLDLSMYLFLVKMDQVYLFLVIPQKYIQVMTHVVWKYRKFNIVQSTKSNQNTPPISN